MMKQIQKSYCVFIALFKFLFMINFYNCITINFFNFNSRMYTSGLSPKIQNLYPKVSFPVGRGTPTIHSLPFWDHNEKWKSILSGSSHVSDQCGF